MFSFIGLFAQLKYPDCLSDISPMILAMGIMIYALYTYHWRAASIRRGGRGPYDDRLGPVSSLYSVTLPSSSLSLIDRVMYRLAGYVVLGPYLSLANPSAVAIIVNFVLRFTES